MFKFQKDQAGFEVSGVRFGGPQGRHRTVMVGSLFYPGHSVVRDRRTGSIDMGETRIRLDHMSDMAVDNGCPTGLMLYAETAEAMASYLGVVSDMYDGPLFMDAPTPEIRASALRGASELGLSERVVYNTLGPATTEVEWDSLECSGVDSAVLLAFNPSDLEVKGRVYLLEDGGGMLPRGLLDMALERGIRRPLLDPAVTTMENRAGAGIRAITVFKAKWGLPTGCCIHNAVESWRPELGRGVTFRYVDSASVALPIMAGADYVLYGPMEYAQRVMPVAAFTDDVVSQSTYGL